TPRSFAETLRMYEQAGEGLLAAHQKGLVHRDFKPDNVLVDKRECARVADFGLARIRGLPLSSGDPASDTSAPQGTNLPQETQAGLIAGTPGYMSPEQYRGEPADSRSDQFSFCVALYQALAGELPFAGDSVEDLGENVLAGRLRSAPLHSPVSAEVWAA